MIDPPDFARIQAEVAQEVREEFESTREARAAAAPKPSRADEFGAGWEEMDVVGKGWGISADDPMAGKPVWKGRLY